MGLTFTTKPISNKEYVHLSLPQIQDELDRYDRALATRKNAIERRKERISIAKKALKELDTLREIAEQNLEIERTEVDISFYEKETKELNRLRENFISSRCEDGEKFVLVD